MSEVQIHTPSAGITLTDAALAHLQKQISKRGSGIGIRLSLKKTGCSGLSYVMDIIDELTDSDKVFEAGPSLKIAVPHNDLPYLMGTEIDFVKQGLNQQFEYHNPNAKGSCGCGESFSVEK